MNINTHKTIHDKARNCREGNQYSKVEILELGIGLDGWGYAVMRGLGWELRNTDGAEWYH